MDFRDVTAADDGSSSAGSSFDFEFLQDDMMRNSPTQTTRSPLILIYRF